MTTNTLRLELHLDGPAVPGRISVDALAALTTSLQTTLRRILSQRPRGSGRFGKEVEQACSLQLVAFRAGSANLAFELAAAPDSPALFGNPGVQAMEDLFGLLDKAEKGEVGWNQGIRPGVLDGIENITKPLGNGVTSMRFGLRGTPRDLDVWLTAMVRQHLRAAAARDVAPGEVRLTGVVWECDWREHTGELLESDGNRVKLEFGSELDEVITDARRQQVMVSGVATESDGRTKRVVVRLLEVLSEQQAEESHAYGRFWDKLDIEELAQRQGTRQSTSLADLAGEWPAGESVDDFLDLIRQARG